MSPNSDTPVPTIADVAQRAGVSTATVSRCINAPDRVQAETRRRVLAAIETLGYTPNFGARALVARRTNTIGAVIPTMENAIFARGLQAFQEALNDRGLTLLVASSQYREDLEADQIRNLIARGVDGLLLIGFQRKPEIVRHLERRGIRAVVAWAYDPDARMPSVGFDNRKAMVALTEEVIARGHTRLGCVSARTASNDRARQRVEGIRAAMARHGLPESALDVVETTYSIDAGATAAAALLERSPRPTVILCGNDVLAVGAIREARRQGLRVPEDVSITGFDDIELATVVDPPLTTVHVPHREMGRRAAEVLLDMIRNGVEPAGLELATDVRLRASLGQAPG